MPSTECLRGLSLLVLVVGVLAASGCSSRRAVGNSYARGAESGEEEGRRAGEGAGFEAASIMAYESSYRETVHEIYYTGEYSRLPFYVITIIVACFDAASNPAPAPECATLPQTVASVM